jgi:hypothetical protein
MWYARPYRPTLWTPTDAWHWTTPEWRSGKSCREGECAGFLLKHSTGFFLHDSEVDVPLSYADYYFMEALYRYNEAFAYFDATF